MKYKVFIVFLGLEITLCVLLGFQALRYWFNPLQWGWPQEIRERGLILVAFALITLFLSVILIKLPKFQLNTKISIIFLIGISTLGFGLFIMLYLPKPPSMEEILKQEDYYPEDVNHLTDCEKVNKFVAIGSRKLDIGNRSVLVPTWLHHSLESIPKDNLIECFSDQLIQQEALIRKDNKHNDEPTRRLHALIFEANKLGILTHPTLASHLKTVACNKDIDYFGKLVLEFYIVRHGRLPAYDYYSEEGRERLAKEICS